MIEFINISRWLNDDFWLRDISFKVDSGKCTVLLGESGSGKSTIARMLMGLIKPISGEIKLNDRPIHQTEIREHRKKFGYVIQAYGLFPHLTAAENIAIAWQGTKVKRPEMRNKILMKTRVCHFHPEKLDRYPAQLSGGEKQRVALMRALINDPDYLIMDEPLGALDPITRTSLQKELKDIFIQLKKTVIMVTHDINEACYFGDQIVLLRKGQIVQKGSFTQLQKRPASSFVSEFIKSGMGHMV